MQNWCQYFYPERPDLFAEVQKLAAQLEDKLETPRLRWKYAWMKPMFGWKAAKWAQMMSPQVKDSLLRAWDEVLFKLEPRQSHGQARDYLSAHR